MLFAIRALSEQFTYARLSELSSINRANATTVLHIVLLLSANEIAISVVIVCVLFSTIRDARASPRLIERQFSGY